MNNSIYVCRHKLIIHLISGSLQILTGIKPLFLVSQNKKFIKKGGIPKYGVT